jgi:hypothetical protein
MTVNLRSIAILWLLAAVWLNCAGWALAALHQVNGAGYALALLPAVVLAAVWLKKNPPAIQFKKLARRFRQPLAGVFLLICTLSLIGGVLYAPANYDGLTYRLPRMASWLTAGTWHWIPTVNNRMNWTNTGWEWMAMPFLALTHSDRALFLINFAGFLLMPGLVFSIFRQLRVAGPVAWNWMWFLPLGYGYVTQAGGIGNDLTGTIFLLLSLYFGLRARRSRALADLWLAVFAAALMTAVKISNAPLGLPCLIAVWPALRELRKRLVMAIPLAAVAIAVSAIPVMVINLRHTGNWTGDPENITCLRVSSPLAGLLGNGFLLAEETLRPPVLPGAAALHRKAERILPVSWRSRLQRDFPRFSQASFTEIPSEECAGLGLGISSVLLAGAVLSWRRFKNPPAVKSRDGLAFLITAAAWLSALVYTLKAGSEAAPRLMLPYYPLMIVPFLLLPGQEALLRSLFGRFLVLVSAVAVLVPLVLSPLRPLWPAQAVCQGLAERYPGQKLIQRMASVYSIYSHRHDVLAPLREALPANVREVGLIAGANDASYSLWRPVGTRCVLDLHYKSEEFLAHPDRIEWIVVKDQDWPDLSPVPLGEWAGTSHFKIVLSTNIVELVSWGPERWTVLHREN